MDISTVKRVMSVQTNVYKDLHSVTADINQSLCVIEQPGLSSGGVPIPQVSEEAPSQGVERHL